MLLQKQNASLSIENNLLNSIIGTCIASGYLNLFITFLQQSIDNDLGKLNSLIVEKSSQEPIEETAQPMGLFSQPMRRQLVPFQPVNSNRKQLTVKKISKKILKIFGYGNILI